MSINYEPSSNEYSSCLGIENSTTQEIKECLCRDGYWGASCDNECPGGASYPCSRHGNCNRTTGICVCDPRWRGNSNCSACTQWWTGADCTIIVSRTTNVTATYTGFGNVISLDGVAFNHQGTGEHILFTSKYFDLLVNSVYCYQSRHCINAVVMTTSSSVLSIHAPYKDGEYSSIWINKKQVFSLRTTVNFKYGQFIFQRHSLSFFEFTSSDIILHVRVFGRYLNLDMMVTNSSWCFNSKGLWGNCDKNSTNDLTPRGGLAISMEHVTQNFIDSKFASSWKIASNMPSMFVYNSGPTNEPRVKTGAGYCLHFKGTGITTKSVFSLTASDVTLEVKVKSYGFNGTVLSYSTTSTLAIVVKGTIKIFYGSMKFETFLSLQTDLWNHIVLVWTKSNKILQFLLIDNAGKLHVRNFPINTNRNIFEPGGILTLGYWYPSPITMFNPLPGAFFGEVDDLRIWNIRLHMSVIIRLRTDYIDCNSRNLASLWKFDEGEGNFAADCASGVTFYLPKHAEGPSWVYSSAPLERNKDFRVSATVVKRLSVERLCNKLFFGDIYGKQCSVLPVKVKWFYAMGCHELTLESDAMKEQVWSVFAYLDYCQVYLGLNEWPGRTFCSQITLNELPRWVGVHCNEHCAFGITLNNTNKCECRRGFYGKECSHECPGGYVSPCGGLSKCDHGRCKCPINANASYDCLTCSAGWNGEDCSVAEVNINGRASENLPICQGYGGGHFTTFDGNNYNIQTPGEYYLVKNDNFAVQVRRFPCMNSSNCIVAIALRFGSVNLTLRAPYEKGGRPLLYIDQLRTDYTQNQIIKGNYFLTEVQPNLFSLSRGKQTVIQVRIEEKSLSFSLVTKSVICWSGSGLCSSCDNNATNDFIIRKRRRRRSIDLENQINVIGNFEKKWVVPSRDSMFIYKEQEKRTISSAVYCLYYKKTAAGTDTIQGSFTNSNDFTIEFFVKVDSLGGTILSYSSDNTFGIVNDNTVKIQFSNNVYDTGMKLKTGQWYWLNIAFSKLTTIMRVHCLDSSGLIYQKTFLVPHELFTSGGTLSLGYWQTTRGGITDVNRKPFNGYIDELRIWTIFIEASAVKQNQNHIYKDKTEGLVALWLFDEGEGTIAHDTISGHNIYLPIEPDARPQWIFSYARTSLPLPSLKMSSWKNQSLEIKATEACQKFILDPVIAGCNSKLGLAYAQYYYIACLKDVQSSQSMISAYHSIVSYADYCQNSLNLPTWPLDRFCNEIPKAFVGNMKGPFCNVSCLFGDVDAEVCVCWKGYWGRNCSNTCPGGAITPCYGHGKCSAETGKCGCYHNWMGNENCTKCSFGWHGNDCSIVTTSGSSSCVGFTGGYFQTFDGRRFSFVAAGEFKVIQSSSFTMHVRQVPCYNGKFRCIDGLAFHLDNSLKLVILASIPESRQLVLWLDGNRLEINEKTIPVGTKYLLEKTTLTTSELRSRDHQVVIKIRFIGKRLQFIAKVPDVICRNSVALGGNCDGIPGNDHNGNTGTTLEKLFVVSPKASLFVEVIGYKDFSTIISSSEYALKFERIGVITDIVPEVFIGDYLTVELMYKSFDENGTLFTYSKENTFSIMLIKGEFCIRTNEIINHTGVSTLQNVWNQISVVYQRSSGLLNFYHIDSSGHVTGQSLVIIKGLFVKGSKFALGQWIPGEGVLVSPSRGFKGKIDEVRIWNRLFSGYDIKTSWELNVQSSARELVILWNLNEGEGRVITDIVSQVNLYIQTVQHSVEWVYSDARVTILPVSTTPLFTNHSLEEKAVKWCSNYIMQSHLGTTCQTLGPTHAIYYYACIAISAVSGYVTAGLEMVVAFSDLCQVSLGMSTWPAKMMCNYPAFVRSTHMISFGPVCKLICRFGTKIENICRCQPGFFGLSCSRVCPGGTLNYCNGHGTCLPTTGHCSCHYNWQGLSCNHCQNGYYGKDCSLNFGGFIPDGKTSFMSLSGNGHFVGLGGAAWVYRGTAEFTAFVSHRVGFNVQLRQVTYGTGVRVRCVILSVRSSVLSIHSSITTDLVVTLDGTPIDYNKITSINSDFEFRKTSHNKLEISGPEGFNMVLHHQVVYFSVQMKMDRSLCQDSCGLFGNCYMKNRTNRKCPAGGLLEQFNKYNIHQNDIDGFMNTWKIPVNESIFGEVLQIAKETHSITAAGTCLFFSETAIITPAFLNVFKGYFLTIQFYLKVKDLNIGATILSFTHNTNFALRVNGTLKVNFGLSMFDTRIYPDHEKWNHISIVYHRKTGVLEIFSRNYANILQSRILHIGLNAFEDGGKLALGLWQASNGTIVDPRGFSGWLDELIIWNKRFDSVLINNYKRISVVRPARDIAALWKFNEGSGSIARDLVGLLHFQLPTPPWRTPIWEPSDLNIMLKSVSKQMGVQDNKTETVCNKIFYSKTLNNTCNSMDARKDFFYQSCLDDMASSSSTDASKESVLSFAAECQVKKNLSSLPGQQLCAIFTDHRFDDWTGTSCDTICIFGSFVSNSCRCDLGYWGNKCSKKCPGGPSNPCNRRGLCHAKTGVCICNKKWRGDRSCTRCTKGWMGGECSIARPKLPSRTTPAISIIGTGGIMVGLDGTIFQLKSVGEFVLMKNSDVEVQARQVLCGSGSLCINAVALSTQSTSVSIHAPYKRGEGPVLTVQGNLVDLKNIDKTVVVGGVTISRSSVNEYVIKYGEKLSIRITIEGQHLSLEGTPSASFCRQLGGLLGTCRNISKDSSNTNRTIPTLLHLLNETDLEYAIAKTFGISSKSRRHIVVSTVKHHETIVVFGGGFSLFFDFTAIFSNSISNLFVRNVVTFEMMVKIHCDPLICGGPILSYTAQHSFYVSTYSFVKVIIGTKIFDTGLKVEVKKWNQITVTFWKLRLEMSVCVTFDKGSLVCKLYKEVNSVFNDGGSLAIGAWQASPNGLLGIIPSKTFVGEIDEFRTWDRAFDYAFLQQHRLANVQPGVKGLVGLWKFDEGSGLCVKDLIGTNNLYFPDRPWNTPVWYYSDLPIPYQPPTYRKNDNEVINEKANMTCGNLFWRSPLYDSCKVLDSLTIQLYIDMCIEAIVNSGRQSSAIESVLLFSDYCMKTLGLHNWPARTLCNNFPGEMFPNWIGKKCDKRCVFGQNDDDNIEHCKCNAGYWGPECDKACPGGANNPCNKHGICHPSTGQCICDLTWRGNQNCSKCSPTWTGNDCSVAVSKVTVSSDGIHVAGIFGLSHFTTLDGRSYTLNITGEYYLFYSVHAYFFIQIRLVYCNGYFSCVNSVAFQTSSHSLIVHGPYITTGQPVIWLDNTIVNPDIHPITATLYGFLFRKQSETLYVFEYSTMKLSIRVNGRYLYLIPKVSGSLCENSYGILGSCNKYFLESYRPTFVLSNCTNNKQMTLNKELARDNFTNQIVRKLVENLEVSACDTLFVYSHRHYREYRNGNSGYALFFAGTAVVSSYIVKPFKSNEVTIEFFLKTIKPGVILSYSKIKTFVLTNSGGYFTIYFGYAKFVTNIKVQKNMMSQIALVFRKSTKTLQFYHFNHEGILTRQDIFIGGDIFSPGGILAIGAWQPSLDGSGVQLRGYFTGYIDELRIWTMAYHPAVISQSWQKQVGLSTKHLARLWKFDEGEGTVAMEHNTGSPLHLETAPWRKPTWGYSELNLKPLLGNDLNSAVRLNTTLQQIARTFCSEVVLINPLHSACKPLGPGISDYYFRACLTTVVTTGDVYASLQVVIAYADYCQSILRLPTWPARFLCNKFCGKEFPVWFGLRCDKKCFNRNPAFSQTCVCRQGYWGHECENNCPGGTVHPCSDHGICDPITGVCSCADNWKGSPECGTCTKNWKGRDCALAIVDFVSIRAVAAATANAHYITFDGIAFEFATVGDFYLIKTRISTNDYFVLQARHAPCQSQSICIVAVAVQFSTTVIVIHAPIIELGVPLIWVNGMKITLNNDTIFGERNDTIGLTLSAPSKYTISNTGVFYFGIRIVGTTLSLAVDVATSYCNNSTHGILGSCDGSIANDLYLNENTTLDNVSQQFLHKHLLEKMEVGSENDMFKVLDKVYNKTSLYSGARYALSFNGSGAISVPLLLTFGINTDITIEFLFKPFSSGTLLSYAYNRTFAITINGTLRLQFDKDYDTGVYMDSGSWYHVAITWYFDIKLLQLYIINNKGNISRREFTISSNPFIPGGVLTLGYWEPSACDNEERLSNTFVGIIDELRVWRRSFNPVTVQQNWRMNVNPTAPFLSGLWKLNEGSGSIVFNLINNEHIHLPSDVWSPPQWIVSDADIALNISDIKKPFVTYFVNETLRDESKSWCRKLFYRGPLNKNCKKLGAFLEFYYLRCVQIIARTTRISSSLNIVIEFSDYCQKTLTLTSWPARTLCNTFGDLRFPSWIGVKCDVPCIFGYEVPGVRNRCKCIHGYWGDDCSKVCPGGYSNPCHGHGECLYATGKCKCDINWRGDNVCSRCSVDWFGEQCHLAATTKPPLNNSFSIASINGQGYYTTFLGISFYLPTYGEFYLIRSSKFYVQVRQSPCMYRSYYRPLCTTAFAFKFENHLTITIRARLKSHNVYYPLVWTNGKEIRVDHVTNLSATIRMTRTMVNRYEITGPQGLLFLLTAGQSLSIQLRIPVSWCINSTGIIGACAQRLSYQNATDILDLNKSIKNGAVRYSESLFVYKNEFFQETQNLSGGSFNLRIIKSHVVSDRLLLGNYDTVTIEVFVKIQQYGGTLLSYGKETFLSVTNEEEVRLVYGLVEIKTGLSLGLDIWTKITLVWLKATNVLQLYYQNFFNVFLLRTYQLKTQIFINQGRLYIGQWKASNMRKAKAPTSDFVGEVDEIRIWNRISVPDLIRRNWNINANVTLPGLLHLWKLDHVEGSTTLDSISGKLLYLPIFNKPSWGFSTLPIPKTSLEDNLKFQHHKIKSQAEQFCYSVILSGSLNNNCHSLGPAVADFYYKICLLDIASTSNISMAFQAVMSFADCCQQGLRLPFWPARELCNRFPQQYFFPGWIGASCDVPCTFGIPKIINGFTICACLNGYWGPVCDKLCPGGLWNVCGNHGKCNPTNGTCECDARWKGRLNNTSWDVPCSVCSHGWNGKDCSIAIESSLRNSTFLAKYAICVAFGDPHVTSSSLTNYHLGITGAFRVFTSISSSLQMLQVPCANSETCHKIHEFGLFQKFLNISIRISKMGHMVTNVTSHALINQNIKTLQYSTSWIEVGETRFRWLDQHRLEVVNEKKIKFTVFAYFGTLAVAIEIPRNTTTGKNGLCGLSNEKREKDIDENLTNETKPTETLLANFNQTTHDVYIDGKMRIRNPSKTVLLSQDAMKYVTGGGYMVRLYESYLALVQDFIYPVLSEFTVEFWMSLSIYRRDSGTDVGKTLKGRRIILGIVQEQSILTVSYQDQLIISWGEHLITTGLVLNETTWTHLTLSWRSNDGQFVVTFANLELRMTTVQYGIMVNHDFFFHRGFFFGHDENGDVKNVELVLGIDELRVWQFARKEKDIWETITTKYKGYVEGLVMFCGFDEGQGKTSNATLYAVDQHPTTSGYYYRAGNETGDLNIVFEIKMSSDDLTWHPSGAPYPNVGNYNISLESEVRLEENGKDTCFSLFYTGNLYKYCGQWLPTQTLFYYEACLMDVKNSKNMRHTKLSVSLFAFYCQKVLVVPSCRLHGFYEGFVPCEEEPHWTVIIIIAISCGGFVFLFLIIIIIILICKRRRKKKKVNLCGEMTNQFNIPEMYNTADDMYGCNEGTSKENEGRSEEDGMNDDKNDVKETSF